MTFNDLSDHTLFNGRFESSNVGIHRHFYQNRFKDQCAKNNFAKIHYPGVTESKSKGDIEEHMFLEIQVI